jgi:hypothetical protein
VRTEAVILDEKIYCRKTPTKEAGVKNLLHGGANSMNPFCCATTMTTIVTK